MTRRLLLACAVAALAGAPGRAQTISTSSPLPGRGALERLGLERQWFAAVPLGIGTERVLYVNLAGDLVFVQTTMSNLHAFDAESGRLRWSTFLSGESPTPQPAANGLPVSVNSDMAFVTRSSFLFALDRATGRVAWRVRLENQPSTGTSADEDRVMVGLRTGKIVAYNVRDRSKQPGGRSAGTFAWAWKTNGVVNAPPVPAGQVVAFGSRDSRVYVATTAVPPQLIFRFACDGPVAAGLGTYGERTLIVPSMDNSIYALDLFDGENRWTLPTGAPVSREPLVAGDTAYALNDAGLLYAIDAKTGSPRWSAATGASRLLAIGATRVYLRSTYGDLIVHDRSTGRVVADAAATLGRTGLNLRDYPQALTNNQNDRLYFATTAGLLVCVREANAPAPRPLRDPRALPFGSLPDPEQGQAPADAGAGAKPAAEDAEPANTPEGGEAPK